MKRNCVKCDQAATIHYVPGECNSAKAFPRPESFWCWEHKEPFCSCDDGDKVKCECCDRQVDIRKHCIYDIQKDGFDAVEINQ